MTTHFSNNVDLVDHNGTTIGLTLAGVLVTKTAAQLNQGISIAAPAAAITPLTNTATGTEIATAVNAIIIALQTAGIIL